MINKYNLAVAEYSYKDLLKNRNHTELIITAKTDIYSFCKDYNLDYELLISSLNCTNYQDFIKIVENYIGEKLLLNQSSKLGLEKAKEILDHLSNTFAIMNGKNFIIDVNKFKNITSTIDLDNINYTDVNWEECGDIFIDFKIGNNYIPFTLKFLTTDYKIKIAGEERKVYNISLNCVAKENGTKKIANTMELTFVPEIYPRMLSDLTSGKRNGCSRCKSGNIITRDLTTKENIKTQVDLCLINKKVQTFCYERGILLSLDKTEFYSISIYECIELIAHICRVYKNRKTLSRKNGVGKKEYERSNISIVSKNENKEHILNLQTYSYNEQRQYKEWQGGHHSSPIEHDRQSHQRVYRNKDGSIRKISEVRETTVNKGNGRGIYKI